MRWSATEFNEFLLASPDRSLISFAKAIGPDDEETTIEQQITDRHRVIDQIRDQFLWQSKNIVKYPISDREKIDYHGTVAWVAKNQGVDPWLIKTQPTFRLEHAILEQVFGKVWEKLDRSQRIDVLAAIDEESHISEELGTANYRSLASLGAAGLLAAFSVTVAMSGFQFYVTMSVAIHAIAGLVGITLPFAVYTAASATVAVLTGPLGWALVAAAVALGVVFAGGANVRKTTGGILQLHGTKVAAMEVGGQTDTSIFAPVGDPLKRSLVGTWTIKGVDSLVDLTLRSDNTASATRLCRRPGSSYRDVVYRANGRWRLDGRRLFVEMTDLTDGSHRKGDRFRVIDGRLVGDVSLLRTSLDEQTEMIRR